MWLCKCSWVIVCISPTGCWTFNWVTYILFAPPSSLESNRCFTSRNYLNHSHTFISYFLCSFVLQPHTENIFFGGSGYGKECVQFVYRLTFRFNPITELYSYSFVFLHFWRGIHRVFVSLFLSLPFKYWLKEKAAIAQRPTDRFWSMQCGLCSSSHCLIQACVWP